MKVLVNVQTQVDKEVKDQAVKRAEDSGFGSLQDVIRLFIYEFARGDVQPRFESVQKEQNYEEWVAQMKREVADIERRIAENDPALEKQTARTADELIEKLDAYE